MSPLESARVRRSPAKSAGVRRSPPNHVGQCKVLHFRPHQEKDKHFHFQHLHFWFNTLPFEIENLLALSNPFEISIDTFQHLRSKIKGKIKRTLQYISQGAHILVLLAFMRCL